MARADILAVVEDQFYEIRHRLDVQLERTAELREQVDLIHGLVKKLVTEDS